MWSSVTLSYFLVVHVVTRMTICLAIIMFVLTGSLNYMVPVIIDMVCDKAAAEAVGSEGCYEIAIE